MQGGVVVSIVYEWAYGSRGLGMRVVLLVAGLFGQASEVVLRCNRLTQQCS